MSHRSSIVPTRLRLIAALCLICAAAVACGGAAPSPTSALPASPTPPPGATAPSITPAPGGDEPIAVLTLVENEIWLEQPAAGRGSDPAAGQSGRQAKPLETLRSGAILRLAADARATIVCFNNRFFQVTGGATVRVTGEWCQDGAPLPGGSLSRVKPDAGRIRAVGGSLILVEEVREKEGDYGNIPIILGPRNTYLLEPRPAIRWVEVPEAIEYVLNMTGPSASDDIVLVAKDLSCKKNAIAASRVCSTTWPAEGWTLVEGKSHFLTISARLGIASQLRPSEDSLVTLLSAEQTAAVRAEEAAIRALNLDSMTQDLLLAGVYAEQELYGDAAAAYEGILEAHPAPVLYVTLGDTYRKTALYRWALTAYEKALDLLAQGEDDPAVRAAAEFGIGQVNYNYAKNYAEAEKHYAEAVRLYEQLGAAEELTSAQRGLEEAEKRSP
jgi:hypothetical protein